MCWRVAYKAFSGFRVAMGLCRSWRYRNRYFVCFKKAISTFIKKALMLRRFAGLEFRILSQRTLHLKHWICNRPTSSEKVMVCVRKVRRVRIHTLNKQINANLFWICDLPFFGQLVCLFFFNTSRCICFFFLACQQVHTCGKNVDIDATHACPRVSASHAIVVLQEVPINVQAYMFLFPPCCHFKDIYP